MSQALAKRSQELQSSLESLSRRVRDVERREGVLQQLEAALAQVSRCRNNPACWEHASFHYRVWLVVRHSGKHV